MDIVNWFKQDLLQRVDVQADHSLFRVQDKLLVCESLVKYLAKPYRTQNGQSCLATKWPNTFGHSECKWISHQFWGLEDPCLRFLEDSVMESVSFSNAYELLDLVTVTCTGS